MSDLVVNVRQISNYPNLPASSGAERVLVQQNGLGGPYANIGAADLVATALANPTMPLAVGVTVPTDTEAAVFAENLIVPVNGGMQFNVYWNGSFAPAWQSGMCAVMGLDQADGSFGWQLGYGQAQQKAVLSDVMRLTQSGMLNLWQGTLTVARDPAASNEVVTLGYLGKSTVASFNNRIGTVQLNAGDIYAALGYCSPITTEQWVIQAVNAGISDLLTTQAFVYCWNGRAGSVYLMLSDITTVFFQPGQQPVTPTPPLTSNDFSIANTQWVVEYIANEFAGGGSNLATQTWVLANTVNSFNGRMGPVMLTQADVMDVGAAPLNSPNFSGIPTAPTAAQGQATGQIATTAFVQQAIAHNTAGVSTFNTRTGDVVLTNADVVAAGGLTNPSPNLTGNPTAPTQAPGTATPVVANCEFVMAAVNGAVTSFNTRTGAITLTTADITGAGGAPLVSPNFSSVPTAPTAAPGTNTVQLATCAFVTQAVTTAGGVSSFNGRTGVVDLLGNDISAAGGLVNPSVNLTGTPTAPTATAGTNSQQIATTAFVATALSSGTVTSFNTRTGAITLTGADISGAGGALLAGPAFTGAPTAPTATAGTNNTQLATTQFVMSAILADTTGVTSFNTRTGAVSLTTADITGAGGAPSASPQFTGIPQAPTATAGTNTTQIATTQFVQSAIASSGVSSFNSRTGAVTLISNDISAAGGALLASPTFTGIPAAPTAALNTNTTQLATTAFVMGQAATVAPPMDGTAAAGNATTWARANHVHPTDTSRAAASALANYLLLTGGTLSGPLTVNAALTTTGNLNAVGGIFSGEGIVFTGFGGSGSNALALPCDPGTQSIAAYINGTQLGFSVWSPNFIFIALDTAGPTMSANYVGGGVVWAVTFSDRRLKSNIRPATLDALATVNALKVYAADVTAPFADAPTVSWDCALIADEVAEVIPHAVIKGETTAERTTYDTLRELPLITTLVRAVQQLTGQLSTLRERIEAVEARLAERGA